MQRIQKILDFYRQEFPSLRDDELLVILLNDFYKFADCHDYDPNFIEAKALRMNSSTEEKV